MKKRFLVTLTAITGLLTSSISFPIFAKSDRLEHFGDSAQFGLPLTAAAISIFHLDGEGFLQLGEGAIWTSLTTQALKATIDAERPDGTSHSFPSAHTSSAAQAAAFLQFRYGYVYGVPAYLAAAAVAYSRVDAKRHYWRDVTAGMAIGTGIQYLITERGVSITNLAIVPYIEAHNYGLEITYQY